MGCAKHPGKARLDSCNFPRQARDEVRMSEVGANESVFESRSWTGAIWLTGSAYPVPPSSLARLLAGQAFAGEMAQYEVTHSDAEWKKMLSPASYDVLRRAGTEYPFSSPLDLSDFRKGTLFLRRLRPRQLFVSDTKV